MPTICKNSSILMIVIYTELVAIFLSIFKLGSLDFTLLGFYSLYLLWLSLGTAALVCLVSKKRPKYDSMLVLLAASLIIFWIIEAAIFFVGINNSLIISTVSTSGEILGRFMLLIISVFIIGRIFKLMTLAEHRNLAESEARMQALQSRIKPHFLFNSLNTISELTVSDQKNAEQAIESLSMLFRAGLETDTKFHDLASEISFCKRYVQLESWRLEERLKIVWNINIENLEKHLVPKLVLQPLIENAIVHGQNEDGYVSIDIDLRESKNDLSVVIENSLGSAFKSEGNGIAIDNIRERLFVLYDDQYVFKTRQTDGRYRVLIRFPKITDKLEELS